MKNKIGILSRKPFEALDSSTGYRFQILFGSAQEMYITYENPTNGRKMFVSANDTYTNLKKPIPLDPRLRYLEVGPGLGYFLPSISMMQSASEGKFPLPIAVDTVDYGSVYDLLTGSLPSIKQEYSAGHVSQVEELIKRCEIMMDPERITLVNASIGLVENLTYLNSIADVLIEHLGPRNYLDFEALNGESRKDTFARIDRIERQLLKPDGKLITNREKYGMD